MQGYYIVTETIKSQLELDPFVNTVNTGIIEDVLLKKADMYPYSHILVNNSSYQGNTWVFNLSVICMDIVDLSKDEVTEVFYGNDNQQDVLNTQLAVINRMLDVLVRGANTKSYILDGAPNCEPFIDRFEHGVAGWTVTFDIRIPNTMTVCGTDVRPVKLCPDFTYLIKDSADNTLYTGSILSGNGLTQTITDGEVTNSLGTVLGNVLAQGNLRLDDVNNIDSDGSTVPTPAGVPFTCTPSGVCADSIVNINGVLWDNVLSGDTENISVRQSTGTTEVGSKQGQYYRIADSDISLNSGAFLSVKAEDGQDIELVDQTDTPIVPDSVVGNKITVTVGGGGANTFPLVSGQTTVVDTGDNGTYQFGREASWLVLSENNPFGNTDRFTDLVGGATYADGICIDWAHRDDVNQLAVGWQIGDNGAGLNLVDAISYCTGLVLGGFTGWKIPTDPLINTLKYTQSSRSLNYPPFNDSSNNRWWTGTTALVALPSYACILVNQFYGVVPAIVRTSTTPRVKAYRIFTYAELGL